MHCSCGFWVDKYWNVGNMNINYIDGTFHFPRLTCLTNVPGEAAWVIIVLNFKWCCSSVTTSSRGITFHRSKNCSGTMGSLHGFPCIDVLVHPVSWRCCLWTSGEHCRSRRGSCFFVLVVKTCFNDGTCIDRWWNRWHCLAACLVS